MAIGLIIAIDGPSAAGKSTVAKLVANKLDVPYIDTGAMYRAVALKAIRSGKDPNNENDAIELLQDLKLEIAFSDSGQNVFIDGENVTEMIRTPEVSKGASDVSAFREVRLKLVELQRKIAEDSGAVMDGRDIGTFVFPRAEFKFYLTADEEERARRRFNELRGKDAEMTFEKCLSDLRSRDKNDSMREFAPLKKADDAVLIDSTHLSKYEVVDIMLDRINSSGRL